MIAGLAMTPNLATWGIAGAATLGVILRPFGWPEAVWAVLGAVLLVVLGLLPVLGVPLPLISAGGSALIVTLAAIGVVLSFARRPEDPTVPMPPVGQRVGSLR